MTSEEFERAVAAKLREYAPGKSEEYIRESVGIYADIVADGRADPYGEENGVVYAAWNISQCI